MTGVGKVVEIESAKPRNLILGWNPGNQMYNGHLSSRTLARKSGEHGSFVCFLVFDFGCSDPNRDCWRRYVKNTENSLS